MAETAGYSGKPLAQKLGIKSGQALLAVDPPGDYADLLEPLPEGVSLVLSNLPQAEAGAEVVHAFFTDRAALASAVELLIGLPAPGGMIWISWPKMTSSLRRDLSENDVRALLLPTGWVDVKVAAIDADWSALKFLRRRT
jgi:hypothetical protein